MPHCILAGHDLTMRVGGLDLGAEVVPFTGLQCLFACQAWQFPCLLLTVVTHGCYLHLKLMLNCNSLGYI